MRGDNTMKRCATIITTILCLSTFANAHAAIISGYGAVADVGTYDDCGVICLRPGGLNDQIVNGGEFATSASAVINNGTATSSASVSFTGDIFSPVLTARSESPVGSNNASDAIATAVQGWTYTGGTAEDYSINLALSGSINRLTGTAEGIIEGRAAVYLFPDATFDTNFSSFIFEEVPGRGTLLDQDQMFLTPFLDLRNATLDFTANPGDDIFIWMQLETKSERGAIVDATSTFEMSFSDGNTALLDETITTATVPLPATLWLFGAGLVGLRIAHRVPR